MIFLTVGTQFPFDRLIKAVDQFIDVTNIDDVIYAQIGDSSYLPRNFQSACSIDNHLFEQYVRRSVAIISHAGMGTISIALKNDKPLLVLPRLKKYGEVVNDHQVAIARQFEREGFLLAAFSEQELPRKIIELKTFTPRKRVNSSYAVVNRIGSFLDSLVPDSQANFQNQNK